MKEQPTFVEKEPIDQNLKEGSLGGLAYTATKEVTLRNDKSRDLAETIRRSQESSNRQSGD